MGYAFYLDNSSKLTGNYISSTLKTLNKIKNYKKNLGEQKSTNKKQELDLNCKEEANFNRVMQIADMNFYRRAIKFQTNNNFLNNSDISNKYIIFIAGNSEAFGYFQDEQKRIHTIINEKLKNKFSTEDIFVVNVSDEGQFINDHIKSVEIFSQIYKPDLVIFYTGGNEIEMSNFYRNMVDLDEILNVKNEY